MAHKMGLVRITLGTKQVNTTYTDYVNNDGTDGITNSTKITITALDEFSGNIPILYSGNYYYVGKAGTKPSFETSSTGIRKWTAVSPTSNLVASTIVDLTAAVAWNNNYYYKAYAYSTVAAQQSFSAKANTIYRIECWGSNGQKFKVDTRTTYFLGGKGGYSKGYISFSTNTTLYLYTGNNTADGNTNYTYNGGSVVGQGGWGNNAGGGTDIRLIGGNWSNFGSLKSRIMVAGGGGGACDRGPASNIYEYGAGNGGYGGGLVGETGKTNWNNPSYGYCLQTGGAQEHGGYCTYKEFPANFGYAWFTGNNTSVPGNQGLFGHAQYQKEHSLTTAPNQGTGGGGWYGGGSGFHCGGGGGSGFISGYPGCVAINQTSSTSETNMVHKTGANCERYDNTYYFMNFTGCYHNDNMALKGGNESFPSPAGSLTGSGTETGHDATGYIIITECPLED